MSWGMAICSKCQHEVHQDGPQVKIHHWTDPLPTITGWRHCDNKTPICEGAKAIYPRADFPVKGDWCGMDGLTEFHT